MNVIHFYKVGEPYGCFSNFSKHPIDLAGKTWPTAEHYFQAMKFADTPREEEIRLAKTPAEAARLGRSREFPLREDWEDVKLVEMSLAVLAKFTQHPDIRDVLLGTGDATLVEHTANDSYWGDGGDGSGQNMLGQVLMLVRDELGERNTPAPRVAMVGCGDWEGLYIDGKLVDEDRSLDAVHVLYQVSAALDFTFDSSSVDGDWFGDLGELPEYLADVKVDETEPF